MKSDFDFISYLLSNFFKQAGIQHRLNNIDLSNLTGWETWFQIEFSYYLEQKCIEVDECYREELYSMDNRKTNQKKMYIDLIIRRKNHKHKSYIALELKQNNSVQTCITNMVKDISKVRSMKKSQDNIRSFWNIGIHKKLTTYPYQHKKEIINLVQNKFNASEGFIESRFIPNTNFAYTIF